MRLAPPLPARSGRCFSAPSAGRAAGSSQRRIDRERVSAPAGESAGARPRRTERERWPSVKSRRPCVTLAVPLSTARAADRVALPRLPRRPAGRAARPGRALRRRAGGRGCVAPPASPAAALRRAASAPGAAPVAAARRLAPPAARPVAPGGGPSRVPQPPQPLVGAPSATRASGPSQQKVDVELAAAAAPPGPSRRSAPSRALRPRPVSLSPGHGPAPARPSLPRHARVSRPRRRTASARLARLRGTGENRPLRLRRRGRASPCAVCRSRSLRRCLSGSSRSPRPCAASAAVRLSRRPSPRAPGGPRPLSPRLVGARCGPRSRSALPPVSSAVCRRAALVRSARRLSIAPCVARRSARRPQPRARLLPRPGARTGAFGDSLRMVRQTVLVAIRGARA